MKKIFENFRASINENYDLNNLALWVHSRTETRTQLFLYNIDKLRKLEAKALNHAELYNNGVSVAMLEYRNPEGDFGPCHNSYEVVRSASSEQYRGTGYGKFLYEIAMSMEKEFFMSDRSSTSDDALKVWNKLEKDSETKPFDNVLKPQTPPPEDDCMLTRGSTEKAFKLDNSTRTRRKSEAKKLIYNHNQTIKLVNDLFGYNRGSFENKLDLATYYLFSQVY